MIITMVNTAKVVAIFGVLVFLQVVSCALARHHADLGNSLGSIQTGTMTVDGYEEGEEGGGPAAWHIPQRRGFADNAAYRAVRGRGAVSQFYRRLQHANWA